MIAKEIVEEVLARTDLAALIGGYVSLKRTGSNQTGSCPFHSERTPSFTVFSASNSFYCFGCGAGGDAITFVRKIENLEYEDAVEFLARRAGIRIQRAPETFGGKRYDRTRLFEMNRDAARFFHSALYQNTPGAHAALAYLMEKRGLSRAVITHFGLGYSPAEYDVFFNHMKGKGYTEDELIAGFLCGRSERGGLYSSFRNRVMFPIIDLSGNIIAFGGRVMDDSQPKYKNSSDTPVFKKSKNLFALNFARTACAEQLILCEGYMDVIAMHAAGFTNAVATLGTALTEDQARMMTRYTKKVIISYDMDDAGRKAADRAVKMFGDVGLEVKLLRLNGAKDPDEFIKKFGAEKFRSLLEESRTKFEYYFESILSKHDITVPQEKIKAINAMCELISGFYSSAERDVYIAEVAKRTDVSQESIRQDVGRMIAKKKSAYKQQETQKIHQSAAGFADKVNADFVKNPAAARAEEAVLGLMLLQIGHRKRAFTAEINLREDDFFTEFGKKVYSYLQAHVEDEDATELLNESFSADEVGRITHMKIARMQLTDNGDDVFLESVRCLREAIAAARERSDGVTLSSLAALIDRRKNDE
ncbi:MAG: DNA primase [Clostridia bacterium]|nr:DNA primase [Clostridia bacterium]